jgi:hypothetical protein
MAYIIIPFIQLQRFDLLLAEDERNNKRVEDHKLWKIIKATSIHFTL